MSWSDNKELLSGMDTISWNSLSKKKKFENIIVCSYVMHARHYSYKLEKSSDGVGFGIGLGQG